MWEFLLGHSLWAFRSGELAFARGWPLWVLFVLGALGLAAIVLSMLRNRQLGPVRMAVLGLLQFAFLALLLVLLWRPVLNVERIRDRENVVALLVDDSGSTNTKGGCEDSLAARTGRAGTAGWRARSNWRPAPSCGCSRFPIAPPRWNHWRNSRAAPARRASARRWSR